MELVDFEIKVVDSIIFITPKDGFLDNSIYEIRLKDIESNSGDSITQTLKLCTKLSPLFIDLYSVKSIVDGVDIEDEVILYHIREASRFAEYIKGSKIDEENVPFEVTQFVKYKAAHECLLRHVINLASVTGLSGTVGNVTFGEKETTKDISKLLEHICKEVAKWTDDVKGFKMEGRASMATVIKGGTGTAPGYQPVSPSFNRGV